ncbi:hypothetical protein LIER_09321 [Lithospermum erythrorhizon]|uniref:BZIP domain-containing protein n=1 Tax=Lithospermum erythrorhizon TaxID=34254 RepID=A0AAV3PF91_LITER
MKGRRTWGLLIMDAMIQNQPGMTMQNAHPSGGFPVAVRGGGRRGKSGKRRRAVEDVQVDKATQQKQRRMIKNRESAARSGERKQVLVSQLAEENMRLLKEKAELNTQRYHQLLENLIPVVEQRKPARVLHKWHSVSW